MRVLVSAQVVAIQLASYASGKAKLMLITQQFSLKQCCDKSTYTAGRTTHDKTIFLLRHIQIFLESWVSRDSLCVSSSNSMLCVCCELQFAG